MLSQKLLNEVAVVRWFAHSGEEKRIRRTARPTTGAAAAADSPAAGGELRRGSGGSLGRGGRCRRRSPSGYLRRRRRANVGAIIGPIAVLIGIAWALVIVLAMANRPVAAAECRHTSGPDCRLRSVP